MCKAPAYRELLSRVLFSRAVISRCFRSRREPASPNAVRFYTLQLCVKGYAGHWQTTAYELRDLRMGPRIRRKQLFKFGALVADTLLVLKRRCLEWRSCATLDACSAVPLETIGLCRDGFRNP